MEKTLDSKAELQPLIEAAKSNQPVPEASHNSDEQLDQLAARKHRKFEGPWTPAFDALIEEYKVTATEQERLHNLAASHLKRKHHFWSFWNDWLPYVFIFLIFLTTALDDDECSGVFCPSLITTEVGFLVIALVNIIMKNNFEHAAELHSMQAQQWADLRRYIREHTRPEWPYRPAADYLMNEITHQVNNCSKELPIPAHIVNQTTRRYYDILCFRF